MVLIFWCKLDKTIQFWPPCRPFIRDDGRLIRHYPSEASPSLYCTCLSSPVVAVCCEPGVFSDFLWPPLCVLLLCVSPAVPSRCAKSRPHHVYTHYSKINRNGRPGCWISMNYSSAAWSAGCVWLQQQSAGMRDGDILGGEREIL